MLNSPGEAPLKYLEAASRLTGLPVEYFRTGSSRGYQYRPGAEPKLYDGDPDYTRIRSLTTVTLLVDTSGNEVIALVPAKLHHQYIAQHRDPNFIQRLPAFHLPLNVPSKFPLRMFEVSGAAMSPSKGVGLADGNIVVAEYTADPRIAKDGHVYVVVTMGGIRIRRVINRVIAKTHMLALASDNKGGDYPDEIVSPSDVLELWEYCGHWATALPENHAITDELNKVKATVALLEERLRQVEKKQLKPE